MTLPNMVGVIQPAEGLNRTKRWRKEKRVLCLPEKPIFFRPRHWLSGLYQNLHHQLLNFQAFGIGPNCTSGIPGSSLQTADSGLLGQHNYMSQFPH